MSEPASKIDRQPESYSPQAKPEIMRMAQQAQSRQDEPLPQPDIVTKKFLLAGFEAAIDLKDEHWPGMDYVKAALKENLHKLGNLVQPMRFFDVWEADPKANYKKKKNHSRRFFFFGVEVTSLEGIPEGFVIKDFPETAYALFKESDHGSPKFKWLEEAGYKFDTKYAEKYAMDIEIYGDIEDEGQQWDALIPIEPPESYSPQAKPEIMKLVQGEHAQMRGQGASQAAPPPGGGGAVPVIHRLITSMHGENYWFNGCAAYVMEASSEPDYDYWFFAGLTGDNFAQVYARDHFRGDGCATDYRLSDGDHACVLDVFSRCGYEAEFIPETRLRADPQPWLQKLMESIDSGVPVIRYWCGWHVCVGYENGGQTLLCMTGDNEEPYRVTAEELFEGGQEHEDAFHWFGWIFVGEKAEQKELRQLYRDAVLNLPKLLTTKTDGYCFGAEAFRALADTLESDRFDSGKPEGFNAWDTYTVYTCNLATNSGGCQGFLQKAMELNPDLAFLTEVGRQYRLTNFLWNKGEWRKNMLTRRERRAYIRRYGRTNLEGLKLGIHNFSEKAFFNRRKRAKAAAILRKMAGCIDEAVRIIEKGVQEV